MAKISHEDFLKMQQERQARQQQFNNNQFSDKPRVGYFALKNDNDSAIVRLCLDSVNDLNIYTIHSVKVDGKFKKINCLRSFKDPISACPLCAAKKSYQQRIFIRLLEYVPTTDDQGNETIVIEPKIWERPVSFLKTLIDYEKEYGSLSECVLKIVRHGASGSMDTKYNFIYPNQNIYNKETYPIDFSSFSNYEIIGGPVVDMAYDEMASIIDSIDSDSNTQQSMFSPRPTYNQAASMPEDNLQKTQYNSFTFDAPTNDEPNKGGQRRITY